MVRQVNVAVMVVYSNDGDGEGVVCADEVQGVVRREDVRATEKEKVLVGEGFRVGDLVRAVVVSLFLRVFLEGKGKGGWEDFADGFGRIDQSGRSVELLSQHGEE